MSNREIRHASRTTINRMAPLITQRSASGTVAISGYTGIAVKVSPLAPDISALCSVTTRYVTRVPIRASLSFPRIGNACIYTANVCASIPRIIITLTPINVASETRAVTVFITRDAGGYAGYITYRMCRITAIRRLA